MRCQVNWNAMSKGQDAALVNKQISSLLEIMTEVCVDSLRSSACGSHGHVPRILQGPFLFGKMTQSCKVPPGYSLFLADVLKCFKTELKRKKFSALSTALCTKSQMSFVKNLLPQKLAVTFTWRHSSCVGPLPCRVIDKHPALLSMPHCIAMHCSPNQSPLMMIVQLIC